MASPNMKERKTRDPHPKQRDSTTSRGRASSASPQSRTPTACDAAIKVRKPPIVAAVSPRPRPTILRTIAPGYLAIVATIVGNTGDARVHIAALGCLAIVAVVALLGFR